MKAGTVVSSKGQVVIPIEIREKMNLVPGTRLTIHWSGGSSRMVISVDQPRPSRTSNGIPPAGSLREVYPSSVEYVEELRREADRDPYR